MSHAITQRPHRIPAEPAEEDIQKCAYFLWKEEGSPAGRDLDFWLRARELVRHRPAERPRRPRRSPRPA